eukprot:jgi/Phyca11/537209/estExt2_fgenesh1_pg.C_PHYCAscaffold_790001
MAMTTLSAERDTGATAATTIRGYDSRSYDGHMDALVCAMSVQMVTNHVGVSLDAVPAEIFKYYVDVERSPVLAADSKYGPSGGAGGQEGKDEKEDSLKNTRADDNTDVECYISAPPKRPERPLPRSLVGNVINAALSQYAAEFGGTRVVHNGMSAISLTDYYTNPDVNVMPVLQALDAVARHLGAQRLVTIEVVPTHRKDRKRAIFGISAQAANQTIVYIKGESMSVADYFSKRYNTNLRYPHLPLVNVGSKQPGKENWLPIELCEVAPGQRCANIIDLDTAEIIRQTSQPPHARQKTIIGQVRQADIEHDPFLAVFGMKVAQRLETTDARIMDPPDVQYANVSERTNNGQWNWRACGG